MRRVLRPGGTFLVSTPHAEATTESPENPFHERELSADDFERLLRSRFDEVELHAQVRPQTARHRTLQRVDVLGLRKRATSSRLATGAGGSPYRSASSSAVAATSSSERTSARRRYISSRSRSEGT